MEFISDQQHWENVLERQGYQARVLSNNCFSGFTFVLHLSPASFLFSVSAFFTFMLIAANTVVNVSVNNNNNNNNNNQERVKIETFNV